MYFSIPNNINYSVILPILLLLFVSDVLGHGRMLTPQIRIPPGDENNGFTLSNGPTTIEPCAGNPRGPVLSNFQSGQIISISWTITAAHRGSCSIQLSTTGQDSNFQELKSYPNCADNTGTFSDSVKLPDGASCNNCTIRWVWNALLTNELYLDCADVSIGDGANSGDTTSATTSTASVTSTSATTSAASVTSTSATTSAASVTFTSATTSAASVTFTSATTSAASVTSTFATTSTASVTSTSATTSVASVTSTSTRHTTTLLTAESLATKTLGIYEKKKHESHGKKMKEKKHRRQSKK
ncbi:8422_t:CDS:1 [Acaulospora morrowiae]|uniref:8422_t:CDS:1 n=1 Tax=Acaulospora morrowiae TaxID=94023 RepID=A0A9N9F7E6_9GLOM|nr:8422_t:CDS:1 [Acaulospora morrowiae]